MSARRIIFILSFSIFFIRTETHAQLPFSQDSAALHVYNLAEKIGSRPVGSQQEQRALQYALEKFREAGLPIAFIMDADVSQQNLYAVNRRSGIAIGIKPGKSSRTILLGAHIDSATPETPGAIDNASGCACILELARALAKEDLQSTLVFCLFGAEEIGSYGSRYFIEHFPTIDSVALMLQIDMANGSDELIPLLDSPNGNSPQWLVEAVQKTLRQLGYKGLSYPTSFFTMTKIFPGGGIGSDHLPFLERGIPAICISSSLSDPFHTAQDDFHHFNSNGLKRSGDLVYSLVHQFDQKIPSERARPYHLCQIGSLLFFVPYWLIILFIIFAGIFSAGALLFFRKKLTATEPSYLKKAPALYLFLISLFILAAAWYSEYLIVLIKGVRYPWIARPALYFVLAFIAAMLGFEVVLRLSPKFYANASPFQWYLRALLYLVLYIVLLLFVNVRLSIYPAVALVCLSLIILFPNVIAQILLLILAFFSMFHLIFSEGYFMFARMLILHQTMTPLMSACLQAGLLLFFTLWFFPMAFIAAGFFSSSISIQQWIRKFSSWKVSLAICVAFIFTIILLSAEPSYNDIWRQNITAEYKAPADSAPSLDISSPEFLLHTHIRSMNFDTTLSKKFTSASFPLPTEPLELFTEKTSVESKREDSTIIVNLQSKLQFHSQPLSATILCQTRKAEIKNVVTPWRCTEQPHLLFIEFAYPDTSCYVPVQFELTETDTLYIHYTATFVGFPDSIFIEHPTGNIIKRTTVQKLITVYK